MVGIGKRSILLLLGVLALQLSVSLCAQGPGSRAAYDSLLVRRNAWQERQHHLQERLAATRRLFSSDKANKDEYGADIIRFEEELFGIRDTLAAISTEIRKLEGSGVAAGEEYNSAGAGLQESGSSAGQTPAGTQPHSAATDRDAATAYLVSSDYMRRSLPPEEYGELLQSQAAETQAAALVRSIIEGHAMLADIALQYSNAEKGARADTLFRLMSETARNNRTEADSFAELWTGLFDNKVYTYNYILDRQNRRDLLSDMENGMREMLSGAEGRQGEYMYDAVALYPLQKELILSYEITLAGQAGLRAAADSLRSVMKNLGGREYLLPHVDLSERLFIDYSDYMVHDSSPYSGPNAVPATEIHPKGTVYRIFLGAFRSVQPIAIFRNVSPLSRELKERMHHYYVGGYRTLEDAVDAAARLKALGFRNPRPVVWVDGVYDDKPLFSADELQRSTGIQSSSVAEDTTAAKASYRIEIRGAEGSLPAPVTGIIKEMAPGKEISRIADVGTGKHLFTVGFFDDMVVADELAGAISSAFSGLDVVIAEVR